MKPAEARTITISEFEFYELQNLSEAITTICELARNGDIEGAQAGSLLKPVDHQLRDLIKTFEDRLEKGDVA